MTIDETITHAQSLLETARSITVLTGAGISAESGIPTYRDENGLWTKYRSEDFSSAEAFRRDPVVVWNWHHDRRATARDAEPNAAHKALVELEDKTLSFTLLTQNVDGLHQRAGSRNVIELHGSIFKNRCVDCLFEWPFDSPMVRLLHGFEPCIPRCPACKGMGRPAVVWFDESLSPKLWEKAMIATRCDVMLVIGTSLQVDPVARLPLMAYKNGARIIEVNPECNPTLASYFATCVQGTAGSVLPQLVNGDPVGLGVAEADMSGAFERGLRKFFEKYPELKTKLKKEQHENQ